jgi:hypothetical protein
MRIPPAGPSELEIGEQSQLTGRHDAHPHERTSVGQDTLTSGAEEGPRKGRAGSKGVKTMNRIGRTLVLSTLLVFVCLVAGAPPRPDLEGCEDPPLPNRTRDFYILASGDREVWIEVAPGAASRYELRIVEKAVMEQAALRTRPGDGGRELRDLRKVPDAAREAPSECSSPRRPISERVRDSRTHPRASARASRAASRHQR